MPPIVARVEKGRVVPSPSPRVFVSCFILFNNVSRCFRLTPATTVDRPSALAPSTVHVEQDLPEETIVGTAVRVMYSVGLVLTSPLQLFPAVKV